MAPIGLSAVNRKAFPEPWLPLLPYLVISLRSEGVDTYFGIWLAYVTAAIAICLVLDARNLWLYYGRDNQRLEAAEG